MDQTSCWDSNCKKIIFVKFLTIMRLLNVPSVLWRCWLGVRKGIRPVKNWVVGCWHGCLQWGADLHIAQQMPLPLTISCSSKSRLVWTVLVLPFWYLLTRVDPDIFQTSSKMVVCVCVYETTEHIIQRLNKWYYQTFHYYVSTYNREILRNAVIYPSLCPSI